MKIAKSFTDGMAIFLAVLILIYLLSGYAKFDPGDADPDEENVGFLDNITNKTYFHLALLLLFSAAAGIILRRRPEIAILTSGLVLSYAFIAFDNAILKKYPMVIILLSLGHAVGTVVFAAAEDRRRSGSSLLLGGGLCAAAGFVFSSHTVMLLNNVTGAAEQVEMLAAEGLTVPTRLQTVAGAVDMICARYYAAGVDSARSLTNSLVTQMSADGTKLFYLNTMQGDELTVYTRLSLLLFAAVVFGFVLKRRRALAMLAYSVPAVYTVWQALAGHMHSLPLLALTFSLGCAVCGIAAFDQYGRDPVSVIEKRQIDEEAALAHAAATGDVGGNDGNNGEEEEEEEEEEIYYD